MDFTFKDVPMCDYMPLSLNTRIDILYTQYHIFESLGISEKLLPVASDIYNSIANYMGQISSDTFIYTGYHWNFDKQEFIKLNNKKETYPLYIKIFVTKSKNRDSYTFRQLDKEKEGKTAMCICIYTLCEDTESILLHELQHMREMYALTYKNIVEIDKKNLYGLKQEDLIFQLFHLVLYMLSPAEQHACLQQVYHYVYNNDNYNEIEIDEYNVKKLSKINDFEAGIKVVMTYTSRSICNEPSILEILFQLGFILKKNFRWKYSRLNKSYAEEILSSDKKVDSQFLIDIIKFLKDLQKKYQRKVYRAIYKAIQDRKNKE